MKRDILQYEYTCDRCGKIERVERVEHKKHELPEGWTRGQDHDCGMTGYSRDTELCGKCGQVERVSR